MDTTGYCAIYRSPLGPLVIAGTDEGVTHVTFVSESDVLPQARENPHTAECARELDEYFRGERSAFGVKLATAGTAFEATVWQALLAVPFGETRSYQEIANALGNPKAIRAVGRANGLNPIAIIVPCHRVIGSDGSLTGYAGELWRKRWLLDHEARIAGTQLF